MLEILGAIASLAPPGYAYGYKKRMKKKEQYFLIDVQSSIDKSSQDGQTPHNADEKQYCQYWVLHLVVTKYIARKQRLLVEALYVS